MATATSTLILALQARNESQAAFAEIRAAMQEQVTQAREASAQQQTAVKASAEQQLLAVKQGLAQQVLAQRQALEQQVAAIRASGMGNVDAQVLAAKQGYEQQVLAAKDAAEQKALAIKTGMAQEIDAVRAGLAQQVDAQKVASDKQIATVRAQAAEEAIALRAEAAEAAASAREGGLLRRVPLIGGALAGAGERLEGPLDLAKTVIGFTAGMAAINAFVEGVHEIPRAFVEATTEGEQFQTQIANYTKTWEDAGKVLDWTSQQALKLPFSLAQIRAATASLAETGIDPTKFLPAAGNIAAAFHTPLTDFIDRVNRAIATGSLRGLESYLHMTKAELGAVGFEWDKHGKLITSSVEPALERLGTSRFGDAMAAQERTAQGGLVQLQNQYEVFKETAGGALLGALRGPLGQVTTWLKDHQQAVAQFAVLVGQALGGAVNAAVNFATTFGPPIIGAINVVIGAWQAAQTPIGQAVTFINQTAQQIGNFLNQTVLPAVYQALGDASQWWQDHGTQVEKVVGFILGVLQTFWSNLGTNMKGAFDILKGIWDIGWGLISGGLGLILDVMTGNWQKFGNDLNSMATKIAIGILEVFNGLADNMVAIFADLPNPLQAVLKQMDTPVIKSLLIGTGHSALYNLIHGANLGITLAHGVGVEKAQEAIDQTFKGWESRIAKTPNIFTGAAPSYDSGAATTKGKDAFAGWMEGLKKFEKMGFHLPGLPKDWKDWFSGSGNKDVIDWLSGGAGGAGGGAGAGTDAIKALQDADSAARKHLEADIARGAPYATLMADRAKIFDAMRAEQKAGLVNADDIFIEMNTTFKDIRQHFHEQAAGAVAAAQSIFTADVTLGAPHTRLLADITAVTDAMTADGDPALQIRAARKTMLDQITKAPGGGKDTLGEAQARFQLLMEKGPLTLATGIADINAIAAAERALPPGQRPSDATITLDVLRDTKDLLGKLLTQADEKLKLDIANHADSKKLLQDEAAYMKLFAMGPGVTKTDIAYQKKQLDDAIASAMGGPATRGGPIAPVPRYGALAGSPETGYGQTVVSFGGAQANPWQSMVAALREQITHLRAQLAKDDQLIALLEIGNATGSQQLGVLRSIDGHVLPGPPTPARSAHSALKAAGSYAPVTR